LRGLKGFVLKSYLKSKTFWVGLIQLIAAVSMFCYSHFTSDYAQTPASTALLINGVAMIVLRWLTAEPITSFSQGLDGLRPATMAKIKEASK